jgi:hypothetical protein
VVEMNVVWLTLGDASVASSRVRAYRMSEALQARGVGSVCIPASGIGGRIRAIRAVLSGRHIVVIQKLLYGRLMVSALRRLSTVLIWECDDAVYKGYPGASRVSAWLARRRVERILRSVDLATTTTPMLADDFAAAGCPVLVYPGPAPVPALRCERTRAEQIVLWLGSPSTDRYLHLTGELPRALEAAGWKCVAVGGSTCASDLGWIVVPWSAAAEGEWLQRARIGVMPQPRDEWSDRKAGYKLLEYAASGVVPVASDVPSARALLSPLGPSVLVRSDDDWVVRVLDVAAHADMLGDRLRDVLSPVTAEACADRWLSRLAATGAANV